MSSEPHIIEPYADGNTVQGEPYEQTKILKNGLRRINTVVNYINKKGTLIEGYVLRVRFETRYCTKPNTSELLNMSIHDVKKYLEHEDDIYVENIVKPIFKRKMKESNVNHKTWLKCIINPVLRKLQYKTDTPYVIASQIENDKFISYRICKVKYNKYVPQFVRRDTYELKFKYCFLKTIKNLLGL